MLRRFTEFVLQSRFNAMMVAFLLAFLPLIGGISILIAALVTLRKNMFEGALVTCAATVPYLLGWFISPGTVQAGLPISILMMLLVGSNILIWGLAVVLQKYNSWSIVIEIGLLIGMILVVIVHSLYPNIANWWQLQFTQSTPYVNALMQGDENKALQLALLQRLLHIATGLLMVSLLVTVFFQLLVARWWQAVVFNPASLRQELSEIRLGYFSALVLLIVMIGAYLQLNVALDLLPVLCMAFFIAALSLIHQIFARTKQGWLWLMTFYLGVVLLLPISIKIVVAIALLDTLFNFRARLNN